MKKNIDYPLTIQDPPLAKALFANPRWSWIWIFVRLYLGYEWLHAGLGKVTNPAWINGTALKAFWERAVAIPEAPARPLITYGWYRDFLEMLLNSGSYTWFAKLVMVGEILVGVALILGIFTGIAAFFGALMNFNFMLAGTASTNPLLFVLAIAIMLAWKVAGYWGIDRWLLPALGTPWKVGTIWHSGEKEELKV